ncbi:MAG: pitrilysin family protein, partial [Acidobacteriota bacterium]|nr:pitrilysin family protein [Acidobacteriota bacterium]
PATEDSSVLLPVADDPTISFTVWLKVGSQNDPAGKEGLAYLTGQMISEGSTTENSYDEILKKLYPLASGYGVNVDKEMTIVRGRTHRDNVDKYLPLYTDAFLKPKFDQADLDRVKSDALNFLKNQLRYASDEELGKAALHQFIFEGTGYAHPPEGTVEGLESITLEDVKAFYKKYYTPDNAVVALGGGFDDATVAALDQAAKLLPAGAPEQAPAPVPAPFEGRHVLLVSKPDADASISLGFPIDLHRGERDFYALWIANSWLGEHRNSSSHLYQVIREKRGMNYGDYSYIEVFPNGGRRQMPPTGVGRRQQIFEIWIRTLPNEDALFALRAALRELDSLVTNGMTPEAFELTRSFLEKYSLHFAETTSARLGYAVDDRFYGIDGEGHLERFRRMMDEITLDEVNAAIKKYLQLDNLKIAIVTGEAGKFSEMFASDAPSPKKYPSEKPAEILEEDREIEIFPLQVSADNITVVPVEEIFQR